MEANIGDTATFNCLVEGIPAPTIDWYINGLPLEGKCACEYGG